ncbi:hypothetical protein CCP1ISM_80009 [Azospirillaceae bacterium]
MITACRQGPPAARVSRITLESVAELPAGGRFERWPTV